MIRSLSSSDRNSSGSVKNRTWSLRVDGQPAPAGRRRASYTFAPAHRGTNSETATAVT